MCRCSEKKEMYPYEQTSMMGHQQTMYPPMGYSVVDPRILIPHVKQMVDSGQQDAAMRSKRYTTTEVALISYLMGMGIDPGNAQYLVESWQVNYIYPE
ncbi:hypothetical protein NV379_12915 [Paenibacillus sp. N1-5-1-14]|uniref:hypothetical protein n=1 Tax=Paenibacillus radicibacter TaxID=2972488 RepID=UPI002158CA71|nr:hypothetical protein [Paenibacillus radicibacter]MCR8643555.1 hypothetical protein [Paenibacillus radicibacter]